jgi:hypothetical protein
LLTRSAVNAVRSGLTILRRPWRLAGVVVGVAYLAWLSRAGSVVAAPDPEQATRVGALGLLVLAATVWLVGPGGSATSMTGAHRLLLLPAPVSRGALADLMLVRAQGVVLANVLLWTLLASRGASWDVLLRRSLALWLLFTTLMLHRALAARVRGQSRPGLAWMRRVGAIAGLLLLAGIPFLITGTVHLQDVLAFTPSPAGDSILHVFALPIGPLTASSAATWAAALPAATGVLAAHYALLRTLGPGGEPPVVDRARAAVPIYRLADGSPLGAVIWKGIAVHARRTHAVTAAVVAVGLTTGLLLLRWSGRASAAEFAGFLALTWAPIVLVAGPQFLPNGLRRDLELWRTLRTLPVSGRDWLLGGALAGGLILAGGVLALLLLAVAGTWTSAELPLEPGVRVGALTGAMIAVPPLAAIAYLVQDGLVLFFPPAAMPSPSHGGPARLGTTLLNTALSVLALLLLLTPALAASAAVWLALPGPAGVRVGVASLVTAGLLAVECLGASRWLGRRFERTALEEASR